CPAQAIRVVNGQAAVISERCIVCGHCIKVCSQNAKQITSDVDFVINQLLPTGNAAVIVAPSFAASFPHNYLKFPAALKELGFKYVIETAFGADLISNLYAKEIQGNGNKCMISSACPAVVSFIEMYYTELVPNLAKVDSPMIAVSKYIKENLGDEIKIVFIGPCIAKKNERRDSEVSKLVDAVLTFSEIKQIFKEKKINLKKIADGNFDPPFSYKGKAYSLAGGLLKTIDHSGDILEKEIIVVEGKKKVIEVIDEISHGHINAKFVDILFCEGCISGPAIDSDLNYYSRRERVINYIDEKINSLDKQVWMSSIYNSRHIDFSRKFIPKNQRRPIPVEEKIKAILAETNKYSPEDELNCGACGYESCREYAIAIAKELAEREMCLPFLIDKLAKAYDDLNNTQEQLKTAEKLASIGQLAAGVAHELNNPLGTIMLYSSMLKRKKNESNSDELSEDLKLIEEEAKRCKNIVSNLLNFARQGKLNISRFDINTLFKNIVKTISVNPLFKGIKIELITYQEPVFIEGDKDQLKQVFINLITNACEAVEEKDKKFVKIDLQHEGINLSIYISDNGCGIPKENSGKIFTPFFTTKKIGKGTGLGLAISYGILKMHRGFITFQSEEQKGTTFKVVIPLKASNENIKVN
ncbi:MAG TPA: [Fe-Fe] hydrogenase large subunit C-terminal domain-containing protein, partial [Ignavibacteriaceae bacterium]|nr:[Fe-Fe] hydrogenase large subunit C-terminal domain-containing protein [Ignavibacteriaceae bacterium]